mgnify:CR=1 FL=1
MDKKVNIEKPEGKLGILLPGLGAVATTFVAGVEAFKKQIGLPIGSLTQMGTIRLGKRTEKRVPKIKDFIELTEVDDIVCGGWDIFEDNAYESAINAGVLQKDLLDKVKPEMEALKPMKGVFNQNYVKKLNGTYIKSAKTKYDYAQLLIEDIHNFKEKINTSQITLYLKGKIKGKYLVTAWFDTGAK